MEILGVTQSLVHHLRVKIISGELAPGQKLNEAELASIFNISRPPLREAFRLLENEYLIVSIPRKGSYVAELSLKDFQEIYEVREILECSAIDLIRSKAVRDLPKMASILEITSHLSMPRGNDPFEKFNYLRTIAGFHFKLLELADNSRIIHFYNSIFSSLARYQFMYVFVDGLMDQSQRDHERIVELIKVGDYGRAKEILRTHIHFFVKFLEKRLKESRLEEKRQEIDEESRLINIRGDMREMILKSVR